MDILNLIIIVCGLTIALMGLFFSFTTPYITRPDRTYLIIIFILLTAYCLSDFTSQMSLVFFGPGFMMLSKCAVFSESFYSSICMPLLTLFILTSAGKQRVKNPFFIISLVTWFIYFSLLCYTQVSDSIYYFTADNVYHRGPLYPLLLIPPVILMLTNLLCLFTYRSDIPDKMKAAFIIYLTLPLCCMLIQMLWYGVLMIVFGTSLASGFLFYFIMREQMDLYIRQREEIINQKVRIMMLEMRPHFIYNTLTSIYYLCEQDSKKAQQVTLDFTTYLKGNFTAISKNNTIPFTEELEHTKAYLSVEMARFEGRLFVEYDFQNTPVFRIPPLTLQPVVENSVKHHGLDPEIEPLHIKISVEESSNGNTIIVEDNGLGPDGKENNEPHIALNNIRERLKLMCRGTLTITPGEKSGTRVTIFIPNAAS